MRSVYDKGEFDEIAEGVGMDNLEDNDIKKFISNLAVGSDKRKLDASLFKATLKGLKAKMSIANHLNQLPQLAFDYDKKIASIGYQNFCSENQRNSLKHLVAVMRPFAKLSSRKISGIHPRWKKTGRNFFHMQ